MGGCRGIGGPRPIISQRDLLGVRAAVTQFRLKALLVSFSGGPVGVETLAAALAEARDALEDVVEPFLIQQGFLQRTPRGRLATPRAWDHLGLDAPRSETGQGQGGLFGK